MTRDIIATSRDTSMMTSREAMWAEARRAWLDEKKQRTGSHHTRRAYRRAIDDWFYYLAQIGRTPDQAAGIEVKKYRDLLAENCAPSTVAQRLAAVSSFYKFLTNDWTLRHGSQELTLVSHNPIDRAQRPQIKAFSNSQKVRPDELSALLAGPDHSTIQGKRDYSILLAFVFTGRRLAELARLRWSDIHQVGDKVFYTYTGKGKGSERKSRELPPPVWSTLHDYWAAAGRWPLVDDQPLWVAHSDAGQYLPNVVANELPQGPLSVAMIRRLVNRYSRQALGREVSPHALRHGAAILRKEAGDDVRAIQKLLDHSSLEMTDGYLQSLDDTHDESWQAVAAILEVEY